MAVRGILLANEKSVTIGSGRSNWQREAERILGEEIEMEIPATVMERRAFMKLPLERRRQMLAEQAAKIASYYETSKEWKDLEGGDLIEY